MQAQWYTSSPGSRSRRPLTVVWVPEAKLQFQWVQPNGPVQIVPTSEPILPDFLGVVGPDGVQNLPYPLIQEVRKYQRRQEHRLAQKATLQIAMDRIIGAATRDEDHLQTTANKFLRDRPAVGKGRETR